MRTIKQIHSAEYRPIDDLVTYSPLPTARLKQIDPFLFLNHHGPQTYQPHNRGLPFGPHPHRGMETVTFIIEGEITHKDTGGHESVIKTRGIQWMTAGRGLVHAEVSSEQFKREGGHLEILQLWLNLPRRLKMTEPAYQGFQEEEIPSFISEDKSIKAQVISGEFEGTQGAYPSLTDVQLSTLHLKQGASLSLSIPAERNIFFYVVRGKVVVNNTPASMYQLVEFNNDDTTLHLESNEDAIVILGHAVPFNEPVVAYGPFVMNSQAEIQQAYQDYQQGKFGTF